MTGLLERDVLVISQEAKLIEMTNKYRILTHPETLRSPRAEHRSGYSRSNEDMNAVRC
jgi:hypothetical protein